MPVSVSVIFSETFSSPYSFLRRESIAGIVGNLPLQVSLAATAQRAWTRRGIEDLQSAWPDRNFSDTLSV
jgi:hypothetical protein